MKNLAAKEAKNNFGLLLDTARVQPVTIEKNGRPVAVLLSLEEYQRFQALEEAHWTERADSAAQEGFIGRKESEKVLRELLNAKD